MSGGINIPGIGNIGGAGGESPEYHEERWPDSTDLPVPVVTGEELQQLRTDVTDAYADCNTHSFASRDLKFEPGRRCGVADWIGIMRHALEMTEGEYNDFNVKTVGQWLFGFPSVTVEPLRKGAVAIRLYGVPGVLSAVFTQVNLRQRDRKRQEDRYKKGMASGCRLPIENCPKSICREEDGTLLIQW